MTTSSLFQYKTFARRETHPARLGALARLQGIKAASAAECSVFEIGCGDGGNLIPLAAQYPNSQFVGVDADTALIEKGCKEIKALGLTNLQLECADISSYAFTEKSFDYVICHGVFSWVSEEVQSAIVAKAARALAPDGVFFVSYNTFPGWRQRGVVRDILLTGARRARSDDPQERYTHALSFLNTIAKNRVGGEDPFAAYIREANHRIQTSEPSYVLQEFLGRHNTPLLFQDFMRVAHGNSLQFLSESRVVMMSADDLQPALREYVESIQDDIIGREQVLDIFRNRTFRETLLCRAERSLQRGLSVDAFKSLTMVANYLPVSGSAGENGSKLFQERTTGREIQTPPGECSDVLAVLASCGPKGCAFADLFDCSRGVLSLSEKELLVAAVTLWRSGFIDLVTEPLTGVERPEGRAKVGAWTTLQCEGSSKVTSALHDSYPLSPIEKRALALAQGEMTFSALTVQLLQEVPEQEVRALFASLCERGFFI